MNYGSRSFFCCLVGSVTSGFGNFFLKITNFSFFPFGSKKISAVQVKKYLGQRQVSTLFTMGQKYAWVGSIFCSSERDGSGQPSLIWVWVWKFPLKILNFPIFFCLVKKKSLRVGSKTGQPLIYCGQKNARVRAAHFCSKAIKYNLIIQIPNL